MKILFLTDNFVPEVNAPAIRTFEHCKEWVENGAEVTVVTCAPNFPTGKVHQGYKNKLWQEEKIDGINVIRVWSYISANEGTIKRIIDYVSFAYMAFWAGLFVKTDHIIATSPQFFTAITGCFLSFFKRKPWTFEVRDLWPESIVAVNAIRNKKIISFLEWIEYFLYKRAKNIVVVTNSFKNKISSNGIDNNKIKVVTNGISSKEFYPFPKDTSLVNRLNLEKKFVVGYIGTHGMAHKLDFILNCAKQITNKEIHFLFIGSGAEKEKLVGLKDSLELDNVTMLDPIPKEEVKNYLNIVDIALVPLKKSDTFKTVIPSKIFESSALEKPIFLGVEGESKEIIEKYNAGLCFEPENKTDFLNKLEYLYNNRESLDEMKKGCSNLAKDYSRESLAKKMLKIIKS